MKHIATLIFILITHSASAQNNAMDPRLLDGDLLFQDLDCGPMCDAIETVTKGVKGKDFSHVGIVLIQNDSLLVLEATGNKGVCITPLQDFLNRSRNIQGQPKVVVGRLKKKYRFLIPQAIRFAKDQVGLPYDAAFEMDNNKYYCSELVYDAFKYANGGVPVFRLKPMTFIDPATRRTFPAWEEYYQQLHLPIPEGQPGCNPGGLSRSKTIQIIHSFY